MARMWRVLRECGRAWSPQPLFLTLIPAWHMLVLRLCTSSCSPGSRHAYILPILCLECSLLPPPTPYATLVSLSLWLVVPVHILLLPQCSGLLRGDPIMLSGLLCSGAIIHGAGRLGPSPVWELPGPSNPGLSFSAAKRSSLPPAPQ